MSYSCMRRGQIEPLAAVVAVFAVGLGVTAYAGVLDTALVPTERNVAEPTLERVESTVTEDGTVRPTDLSTDCGPDGYDLRVTVTTDERWWAAGPRPPRGAQTASRFVSVRVEPGVVEPGRLRVEVWR